jgi:cytochrome c553
MIVHVPVSARGRPTGRGPERCTAAAADVARLGTVTTRSLARLATTLLATTLPCVALLAFAAPAHAGDPVAGLGKSAICASCHGPLGLSPVPTYPNLAGQNQLYLEYALRLYRSGERRGDQAGMMYTVAQALSDTDIADLSAYYAALPRPD